MIKDFYISVDEYCEILVDCMRTDSENFLNEKWHPEDLFHQIDSVSKNIFATLNYLADRSYSEMYSKKESKLEQQD